MPESTLKPRIAGKESTVISTKFTPTAFLRLQPPISMKNARISSNTAMMVESAAKDMKMKNSVPQILPPAMLLKSVGSVMNSSDGPEPGSTP